MRVLMKVDVSGSRDGVPWPKRGEPFEVPDDEGTNLCSSGLAEPVADIEGDVEKAVPDEGSEKRAGLTTASLSAVIPNREGNADGSEEKKAQAPAKKSAPVKRAAAKPSQDDSKSA